jgi:hypothetical protein
MFVVAWDLQTKAVTYIFTSNKRFITDSGLSVGGLCRLVDESGRARAVARYWLISCALKQ